MSVTPAELRCDMCTVRWQGMTTPGSAGIRRVAEAAGGWSCTVDFLDRISIDLCPACASEEAS